MNTKLEGFKKEIKGKRVAVLGIGISNTPLIKYLAKMGVDITAFDKSDEQSLQQNLKELSGLGIKFSLGENYLASLKGFDVIFKTPKVRFDITELVKERERGAEITSEMEVFCRLCPAKMFAVTGSDGKTTTTTLIYRMLTEQGYTCWLGGNIGTPLLDRIDEIRDTDMVVLELSSFQLHTMRNRLQTALVTNLSPNHLDVHSSMDEYIDAKRNILRYQEAEDKAVLNYDNEIARSFGSEAKGSVMYFSRKENLDEGVVLEDGAVVLKAGGSKTRVITPEDIILPGVHNLENYMAAIAVTVGYVDPQTVKKVASTFRGVEHRIEHVRDLKGVRFYNDSIGSSPTRTIASIRAFNRKVILIAGGYDKHIPYDEMGSTLVERIKALVLLGQTSPLIEKALKDETERTGTGSDIPVIKCAAMEEAVKQAYSEASEGDIVLLSPASASFDLYKNFEERGEDFKRIVNLLD